MVAVDFFTVETIRLQRLYVLFFIELWPIFRVAELRERSIDYWAGVHATRAERTRAYVQGRRAQVRAGLLLRARRASA